MRTIYFPDANFFIQCKHPKEIEWALLDADNDLEVWLSRAVLGEIDHFKHDGNRRRADRARKFVPIVRSILESKLPVIVRESPTVSYCIPPQAPVLKHQPQGLHSDRPDDMHILEILGYKSHFPDRHFILLTNDVLMKTKAIDFGVECILIPDSWQLPPESNPLEKRNRELEEQVAKLLASKPQILVDLQPKEQENGVIKIEVELHDPLDGDEMADIEAWLGDRYCVDKAELLRRLDEEARSVPTSPLVTAVVPSNKEVEEFFSRQHSWVNEVLHLCSLAPEWVSRSVSVREIDFTVENTRGCPGEGFLLEIEASHGLNLFGAIEECNIGNNPILSVAKPPSPPRVKLQNTIEQMLMGISPSIGSGIAFPRVPGLDNIMPINWPDRDARKFYWNDRDDGDVLNTLELECQECRHGVGPRHLSFYLVVDIKKRPKGGTVTLRVTCKNAAEPLVLEKSIKIMYSTKDDMMKKIKEGLSAVLEKKKKA